MRFSFTLISSFLLASAVVAHRRHKNQSQSIDHVERDSAAVSFFTAGASLHESRGTFTSVSGTFTFPSYTGAYDTAVNVWVALDDSGCSTGRLVTGMEISVDSRGAELYIGYYQWNQDGVQTYPHEVPLSVGDSIELSVSMVSATRAQIMIKNHNNGKSVQKTIQIPNGALCGQEAVWRAGTVDSKDLLDFGELIFTDAHATGNGGTYAVGGTIQDIITPRGGYPVTSTSINGYSMAVRYVLNQPAIGTSPGN